tara:strand:+ start:249 stop:623 length:375 start_codon:yes stop_codon:yes gene_type:complete
MSYIEKTISGDEKIISIFKIHSIIYVEYILFLWLIIPIFGLLKLFFVEYGLTSKRVIFKSGIISRNTEEMRLSKIETVEVKQGIIGRIFGYGNVIVTGTGTSSVVLNYVSNPLSVKKKIDSQLD